MNAVISRFMFCALLLESSLKVAAAAPDPSCARKFVGSWTTRVLATGQTYPGVILPNGVAHVTCPMCRPTGTWICSGNTITFIETGSMALSPDGRTMTSACCISTRMGRAPAVAAAAQESPADISKILSKSASCSDITGTSSGGPAATNCRTGNSALETAKWQRVADPAAARKNYQKAADAYRRAGDIKLANKIMAEVQSVVEALPANPSSSALAEEPCAASKRDAAIYITGAEAIEKNDATCAGLTQAAENYFAAGKIYNRAMIKLDQPSDEVAKSCEFKLQNLMFLHRDALNDRVDKMKQEGKCGPGLRIPPLPIGGNPKGNNNNDDPNGCAGMRERLASSAPYPGWVDEEMRKSPYCNLDGTPKPVIDEGQKSLTNKLKKEMSGDDEGK